jgi:hypothetical protein
MKECCEWKQKRERKTSEVHRLDSGWGACIYVCMYVSAPLRYSRSLLSLSVSHREMRKETNAWKSKSAKECVTTHLPNELALKMDGAEASDLKSTISANAKH